MKKVLIVLAITATVLFSAVGSTHALTIIDVFDPAPDVYIKNGFSLFEWFSVNDPYSYPHNILDYGYNPATDTVVDGLITLELYDDESNPDPIKDNVRIYFSDDGVSGWNFQLQYDVTDFSTPLPIAVNPDDLQNGIIWVGLDAKNKGFGNLFFSSDFYLDKSTLEANVISDNVVPEPATMLLFSAGLLGAFVRRRKRS